MIVERWLELAYDGCFNYRRSRSIYYSVYTSTSLVPTSHPLTVPAAHEPGTRSTTPTTPTVVWSRPRSGCDPVAHHIATEPRLRPSFSVYRALTAASSSVLPPSRRPSGRPPRPRPHRRSSSAVQPRDVSSILTILSDVLLNNNIHLHSVGTNMLILVIPRCLRHRTEQLSRSQFPQ